MMSVKRLFLGVAILQVINLASANSEAICQNVKRATDEMEKYLLEQSLNGDINSGEMKLKEIQADYDKTAAKLTVLRGILKIRSEYDRHLRNTMLAKGLDPVKAEESLKELLVAGDKMIGLNGLILRQRKRGSSISAEEFSVEFAKNCKRSEDITIQGMSVLCHSLSATYDANNPSNITVAPGVAKNFFESFLTKHDMAWEGADPNKEADRKAFNDQMILGLNRGAKDVDMLLTNPDKFSLQFEKEALREASGLYRKFSAYASCIKNHQKNCDKLDPNLDGSFDRYVNRIDEGLNDEEGGAKGFSKYKPFIYAELEHKFGLLDQMSKIIDQGIDQQSLLQISHPVLNDIYRSLELAYRKNGPQSFKNNPSLAEEIPRIIEALGLEIEGLGICRELMGSIASRQNSDKGLATCLNGLTTDVLGKVADTISALEAELKQKEELMASFSKKSDYKIVSDMKYELLGYLVTQCGPAFKQQQAYCNPDTDLKSAFSGLRFLEGNTQDILIELDRELDTKTYSINTLKDYCKREQKYPLPSVASICQGIDDRSIAVSNQKVEVLSNSGAKIVRPPQTNYRAERARELASSAKAFKELSKDEYVHMENGTISFVKKNTMNDNLSFAIKQNQGSIAEVVGLYFYGRQDGMLDLQLQQMKMQHQAQLQYDYNMNSLNQQMAQYQTDYYNWIDEQYKNGNAFNSWAYGYNTSNTSDGYQQYLQNRTGTVNVDNGGYSFNSSI